MKKIALFAALGLSLFFASCSKNSVDPGDINPPTTTDGNVVTISSDITTNTTFTADKIYLLKNKVYVTNNATLTIQAGTIIKGDKPTQGTLIITRGAKIEAVGTVDKPIVFTSNQPVNARKEGDWGGVVLLGKAPNNAGNAASIEGISDATDKAKYGGDVPTDNSGTLKYVRIEYAGIPLGADNELNGLTFGSVGSGTTIDYVTVYKSGDDAFEWFGGTVNCKHLVAIGTWDDDFDTDFGYSGKIQFAVAQRLANTADVSGSNGFESDNNGSGAIINPRTAPVFANVTILGPREAAPGTSGLPSVNANYQHAAQIRRYSAMSLINSVIVGYTQGVFYDDTQPATGGNSSGALLDGTSVFTNNLVLGSNATSQQIKASNAGTLATITAFLTPNNVFDGNIYAGAIYAAPYKFGADLASGLRAGTPDFKQVAGSIALTGATKTDAKIADSFFEKVDYRGAFDGTTDWTQSWVSFNPQSLPYTTPGAVK